MTEQNAQVKRGSINIIPAALAMEMSAEALGKPNLFVSISALNECPVSIVRHIVETRDWFGVDRILLCIKGGRIPDGEGYYDLRMASVSFGKEKRSLEGPVPTRCIVQHR